MNKTANIVVIAGGLSAEREVSLRSGENIFNALKDAGYTNTSLFDFDSAQSLQKLLELKKENKFDAAILMTHGNYGEDGCLQGFLEILDVPYSGSNVQASSNCMDKLVTKAILSTDRNLNILPSWFSPSEVTDLESPTASSLSPAIYKCFTEGPLIVKPISEGSSVGITKVKNIDSLMSNQHYYEKYPNSFIEPFINGVEITASILDFSNFDFTKQNDLTAINDSQRKSYQVETNKESEIRAMATELGLDPNKLLTMAKQEQIMLSDHLLSLPLLELKPKNEFYDYEAKYTKGLTEFILPAKLPSNITKKIHKLSIEAFRAMNCRGFARVDFMVATADEHHDTYTPYLLELNTLPGMTNTSDLPAQAKTIGIDYSKLADFIAKSIKK